MKIIIILLAIILTSFVFKTAEAQVTRPPYFDTCQYLQPLQGEWMNINGTDTIRIYLRYHRNFYSDPETYNSTIDELWGWIEYKQGNTILTTDYANRFANLPYNLDNLTPGLRSIVMWPGIGGHKVLQVGYSGCQNPILNLSGKITDLIRCNVDKEIIATVNSSGNQMTWNLQQPAALLDSEWCAGITLPREFTLIKQ